jgi:hypothetical protein
MPNDVYDSYVAKNFGVDPRSYPATSAAAPPEASQASESAAAEPAGRGIKLPSLQQLTPAGANLFMRLDQIVRRGPSKSEHQMLTAVQKQMGAALGSIRHGYDAALKDRAEMVKMSQSWSNAISAAVGGKSFKSALKDFDDELSRTAKELADGVRELSKPEFYHAYCSICFAHDDLAWTAFTLGQLGNAMSGGAQNVINALHDVQKVCTTALSLCEMLNPVGAVASIAIAVSPEILATIEKIGGNTDLSWQGIASDLVVDLIFKKYKEKLQEGLAHAISTKLAPALEKLGKETAEAVMKKISGGIVAILKAAVQKYAHKVVEEMRSKKENRKAESVVDEVIKDAVIDWLNEQLAEIARAH